MAFFRLLLGASMLLSNRALGALQYKGADWSSVAVMERNGIEYKRLDGTVAPLETILAENGINLVRQRVWVAKGDHDLDYNIALCKRAKAAGLDVRINLHYSDSWADPGLQTIPAGWPQDLAGLEKTIYDYTLSVSNALQDAGCQPAIIDIGNEIAVGLLFPIGNGKTDGWNNTARLLSSASEAIKASTLKPLPAINVHLPLGSDQGVQDYFWTNMLATKPWPEFDFLSVFDTFSASFYPWDGPAGTFDKLTSTLTHLTTLLPGKNFTLSEIAWPFKCDTYTKPHGEFPPDMLPAIPFNATGQATWVKEVANRVAAIPGGMGLEYWEIAWVENAGLGNTGCEDNVMFYHSGYARESLAVFSEL